MDNEREDPRGKKERQNLEQHVMNVVVMPGGTEKSDYYDSPPPFMLTLTLTLFRCCMLN